MERAQRRAASATIALAAALALGACQKDAPAASAAAATPDPAAALAAPAKDAGSPKGFLEGLYAHYATSSSGNNWAPMDNRNARDVFDGDTAALLAADQKALKGELGDIDGDWLCDCQDWGAIVSTVTVTAQTPTTAKATADFHDTQIPDDTSKHDTFDLVKTPAGWRIHDMGTPHDSSLRHVLTREIAALKTGVSRPLSMPD